MSGKGHPDLGVAFFIGTILSSLLSGKILTFYTGEHHGH